MSYDLSEHRHRFAVWAAARATQRGFTTVANLREALESTDIRERLSLPATLQATSEQFDTLHDHWCIEIRRYLKDRKGLDATYGRAAKLIAVYLKACIVLGEASDTPLGRNAHPPIDRILLRALASSDEIQSANKGEWREINWTELDAPAYRELIAGLRRVLPAGAPFWAIEKYWQPSDRGDDAL